MKKGLILSATLFFIALGVLYSSKGFASEESTVAANVVDTTESTNSEVVAAKLESTLSFKGLDDHIVELGANFDPRAGVTAEDSIEGDLTDKIKITGTVDTSKFGEYPLNYSVENAAGKKLEKKITVSVSLSSAPVIEYHTVEIPELTLPRYADYKQAIKDKVIVKNKKGEVVPLEDVDYSITSETNTDKLGKMWGLFTISYSNGTQLCATVKINVISGINIVQPDIYHMFYVGHDNKSFDPYSFFSAFEIGVDGKEAKLGKYDSNTKVGVRIIDNPVDFSKPGDYTIRYRITNSLGEEIDHSYVVTVNELKPLKITVADKVLYVGDKLTDDIILGWPEIENADTLEYEVLDKVIPVNKVANTLTTAGEYSIRYVAYQDTGDTAEATIKLTVKERPIVNDPTNTNVQNQSVSTKQIPVSASTKKATLPNTGSENTNILFSMIGFILIGSIVFFKTKKTIKQ